MDDEKIKKELILREIYYENPKTSYRSPQHLWELAKEEDPDISKYFVKQWLLKQSAYTRFKKFNHPKHYRHTMVRDFNQVQMDIVFLLRYKDENDGYQYILSIIDILSRFAFAFGQKTKGGMETKENIEIAFEQFKKRFGHYPKLVQFDRGTEFKNQNVYAYFKSLNITYFSTSSPT